MKGPRDGAEQLILLSIGIAHLTRERAEAVVGELVRKGQIGADDGRQAVEDLMARVRGDGAASAGMVGRLEGGVQGALRELGVITRSDLDDLQVRLAELEHRVKLLEASADAASAEVS